MWIKNTKGVNHVADDELPIAGKSVHIIRRGR